MVTESWFTSFWRNSRKNALEPEKLVIGVLAYEVAGLMSKVVHLWKCLSDKQVARWREEIMNSVGVRKLVSEDNDFLTGLVFAEMVDNLGFLARSVAMLGKKCTDPVLQGFERVFDDLIKNDDDLNGWEFNLKKMERKVRKMERFIKINTNLYPELEVLAKLQQTLKITQGSDNQISSLEFKQRVDCREQEVNSLKDISLWNRTYDYTVRLLGRSLFTIFRRIERVFGINRTVPVMVADYFHRSQSFSAKMPSSVQPSENDRDGFSSGLLRRSTTMSGPIFGTDKTNNRQCHAHEHSSALSGKISRLKTKRLAPIGPFKGCMMGGNDSPVLQSCTPVSSGRPRLNVVYTGVLNGSKDASTNLSLFKSNCRLLNAPPSTLGAAALACHYATVVIVIEKLVTSPHFISPDARDDLYNKLPTSVRAALRRRLKSYSKNLASTFCDTLLAAEWSEALTRILEWLAPLAHNMIKWQSERNFVQQHLVSRTTVLLVQTLYFANQAKTEAAITELLVGLNYMWRNERYRNAKALVERSSGRTFGDYLDDG